MARYRTSFDTDEQAVVEALFLSLMAPDKSEAAGAAKLAQELAGMDAVTMEKCKAAALERFKIDAEWGLRT